jgi:hypothetical protein
MLSVESVLFLLIIKTDDNHCVSGYNYVLIFIATLITTAQRGVTAEDVKGVPLATEPGISLIILTPLKIWQRNLNRSTFVVREMKRNVSVSASNFDAIFSLVVKLLKKRGVR